MQHRHFLKNSLTAAALNALAANTVLGRVRGAIPAIRRHGGKRGCGGEAGAGEMRLAFPSVRVNI